MPRIKPDPEADFSRILKGKGVRAVSRWRRPNHSDPIDEQEMLDEFKSSVDEWFDLSTRAMKKIKA
jgi:hypothetical protein